MENKNNAMASLDEQIDTSAMKKFKTEDAFQ
jgi:predicted RND superfamily exporter protein